MTCMLPAKTVNRRTTTRVSDQQDYLNMLLDFDVSVLVKNANVKNNYFSVIFSEGVVFEEREREAKEQIIEETKRDPKKSYAF